MVPGTGLDRGLTAVRYCRFGHFLDAQTEILSYRLYSDCCDDLPASPFTIESVGKTELRAPTST